MRNRKGQMSKSEIMTATHTEMLNAFSSAAPR